MRLPVLPVCAVLLAGCIPDAIETEPVQVSLTAAGRAASPNFYAPTKIRVYENVGKKRVWIEERTGVECNVSSPSYSVDVRTPAIAMLPTFGNETQSPTLSCKFNGEVKTDANFSCFFTGGDVPIEGATDPRGKCSHADMTLIFGK